ncbi:hypothetical protein [Paenibacillus arenilitoris]|uniref:Uncharacterized protein n=1 Tax=Paenibacillus arenilitoris TaxID=2772299 RepID=A0A927CPD2_9BACL|nr:hypothetical protein [Paenibacillus arenilitoris]MBD2869275.1 hypothetical protein [Paenibacillus arenilitoris]
MSGSTSRTARHPSQIATLLVLGLTLGIMLYLLFGTDHDLLYLSYLTVGLIVAIVIMLAIAFRRARMKPFEVVCESGRIVVDGRTVEAKGIDAVLVMGYFRPVIGIKPINKKLVPYELSFRFLEQEDRGIKQMEAWAERHQIQVAHKHFTIC